MTPSSWNDALFLRNALCAHWRAALFALAFFPTSAALATELSAACDPESVSLPVRSQLLSDHLLAWMESTNDDVDQWRSTRDSAWCGDAEAIARLNAEPGQGATGMLALATLINIGDRKLIELPSALGRAGLPEQTSAEMLTLAYRWMVLEHTAMSAKVAVADTQWAVDSGNPALSRAGWELRAVFQDPDAVMRREQRLATCAAGTDSYKDSSYGCLNPGERFTASNATITGRWKDAPPKERAWLTLWAAPTQATEQFFFAQLADQTQAVQYAILTHSFGPQSTDPSLKIKGALIILQQALDDPARRPEAIAIDFSKDYGEGLFGAKAYADSYPIALQAAFEELATYPDATEPMKQFVALDNPWLVTQAGVWLFRNGHGDAGRAALRYTLEDDGLPPSRVLSLLVPIDDGELPEAIRTLFVDTVRDGALGKWDALAVDRFKPLLSETENVDLLSERIASVPGRVKLIHGAFTPNQPLQQQMESVPGLKDEMHAFDWAFKELMQSNPLAVDKCIERLASESEEPWRAFAMALAAIAGRNERAEILAKSLIDSPWPLIADKAKQVLAAKEAKAD